MIKSKEEGNVLILTNSTILFPTIGMIIAFIVGIVLLTSGKVLIGTGVAVAGLLFLFVFRIKKYIFDTQKGTLSANTRSLIRAQSLTITLSDITRLRVTSHYETQTNSDSNTTRKLIHTYFLDLANGGNVLLGDISPVFEMGALGMNSENLPKPMKELVAFLNIPVEIEPAPTLGGVVNAIKDAFVNRDTTNRG